MRFKGDSKAAGLRSALLVSRGSHGARSRARVDGVLFATVLTTLLLASCGTGTSESGSGETQPAGEQAESAGPARAVSVSDYAENPAEFYGDQIELSGRVTEFIGPNVFVIGEGESLDEERIVIAGARGLDQIVEGDGAGVSSGQIIQATGTARQFDPSDIESKLGYDLSDELSGDFVGNPGLIAESVEVRIAGDETTAQSADVSLDTISDRPAEFYGQTVTVRGPIARVIDSKTFVMVPRQSLEEQENLEGETLYDTPEELAQNGVLVKAGGGQSVNLAERQTVRVTGQVRRFHRQAFREEYNGDFTGEVYEAFSERPAIVASQVHKSAGGGSTARQ